MRIDVITIFPQLLEPFLSTSLIGRARQSGTLDVAVWNLREFSPDRHRSVDDEPYGGGPGMVMTPEPWTRAVRAVVESSPSRKEGNEETSIERVLLSPQGEPLDDRLVRELAGKERLVLLCGRYEGVDERVRHLVVDREVSIGDYVLSGGEVPAMVLIEALSRQLPGVVGSRQSVLNDSFRAGLLDHPHYTRPRRFEGLDVPPVLLGGDHAAIEEWRREQALAATAEKRPDLVSRVARKKA